MRLSKLQEKVLGEMAIPIWASRQPDDVSLLIVDDTLMKASFLVLLDDKTYHNKTQLLLKNMLFAIGVNWQQVAIVTLDKIAQLHHLSADKKMLLALGESALKLLIDNKAKVSDYQGKVHKTIDLRFNTVVSIDLDELLVSPEKKALAWQDLRLISSHWVSSSH